MGNRGINEYTRFRLDADICFPKGDEVCRYCVFCIADPINHKREICYMTGTILTHADISIEGDCPLKEATIGE